MTTAIFVTARLKSVRLPRKVLLPIHGREMIAHMLDRLKLAKRPERIVICTSTVEQDDPLEELAHRESVDVYRGDPDDVLLRNTEAAKLFGVDTVVSCTADNPFVAPEYIDALVDFHREHRHDFSNTSGLPWGAFAYALSRPAMETACAIKDQRDTEVWAGYFTQTGRFRWGTLEVDDPAVRWPELRVTVDTPEDFELVTRIFDELAAPGRIFTLAQIVGLCREKPDIPALNAHIQQKTPIPIRLKFEERSP